MELDKTRVRGFPAMKAPPGHGGARKFFCCILQSLIRRWGVPSGAAAFIVSGKDGTYPLIILE
jgi:hypothetical protein